MNDDVHAWNEARPDRQNTLARYRHIEKRLKRQKHRRWGGRLFALAGFLLLAGGLSIGAWGNYSQQQDVTAVAKQRRGFVPTVRVATVEPSPSTVSVTLPGTTAAFTAANIFARATGYSPSETPTSVTVSRQEICWLSLPCRRSMRRLRRTRRRSISSGQHWSRRRQTETSPR